MSLDSMRAMVGRRDEGERGLLLEALLEAVDAELCNGGKPPHECFLSIRSDQKGMVPEIHTTPYRSLLSEQQQPAADGEAGSAAWAKVSPGLPPPWRRPMHSSLNRSGQTSDPILVSSAASSGMRRARSSFASLPSTIYEARSLRGPLPGGIELFRDSESGVRNAGPRSVCQAYGMKQKAAWLCASQAACFEDPCVLMPTPDDGGQPIARG